MEVGGDHGARSRHVVMLPSPGIGHLTPLAELACHLALRHGLSVTLVATADCASSAFYYSLVRSLPPGVAIVALPPVDDIPEGMHMVSAIFLTIAESLPALRRILADLVKADAAGRRLVAFVTDLFGTDALQVAREFDVPSYLFFPSNLTYLSFSLHLASLHEAAPLLPDPLTPPGCLPVYRKDLPDLVKVPSSEGFKLFQRHLKGYRNAEGILVNSFEEMEPEAAAVFREDEQGRPPVYLVGPILQTRRPGSSSSEESTCLRWLDKQGDESVLYICLGSAGVLSFDQMNEMAFGLEMCGHRFLWVVRSPVHEVGGTGNGDPLSYLPEGFLERTKETGLVVPTWAPQEQILRHRAVGGFITHCGWSSILESIVHGVPMIAWPLYGDQMMNAQLLVEGLKVALRPSEEEREATTPSAAEDQAVVEGEEGEGSLVRREAISVAVEELMAGEEGRAARERVRLLRERAENAKAEGGPSSRALAEVVATWKASDFEMLLL